MKKSPEEAIAGNQAQAMTEVARVVASSGDVAQALRIAGSISLPDGRKAAIEAVIETRAAAGDVAGAMAAISALPPAGRQQLEFLIAVVRARAGDPSPVLKTISAAGGDPAENRVLALLAVIADLLWAPCEEKRKAPFWDLDFHPFDE